MSQLSTLPEIERDQKLMKIALEYAHYAEQLGEVPIGAVIVDQCDEIVGKGYNVKESLKSAMAHAELLAIAEASQQLNRWRLNGCTIYTTLEPCVMCAGALIQARISRIVYGASDPKGGGCGGLVDIFSVKGHNHYPEITSGVLFEECGAILSNFFGRLRRQIKESKR